MTAHGQPPPHPQDTAVLLLGEPPTKAGIPRLCDRLRALLATAPGGVVVCDVTALGAPDAVTVEALARLQLTARRAGGEIRLRGAHPALRALLDLAGLGAVLPPEGRSPLQVRRQAEQREQAGGVQEGVEPGDPAPF
ncbi:hypothetical protein GCM10027168_19520 [Streptomyces capparidis]